MNRNNSRRFSTRWTNFVLAVLLLSAFVQAQNTQAPSISGVVVSGLGDGGSFTIVDKTGNMTTLATGPSTSFIFNKAPAGLTDVVRFGMDIKGTLAANGSLAEVTTKGVATQLNLAQIPAFLGASEAEWTVLRPKIEKIQALQRAAEGKGSNNNGTAAARPNAVQITLKQLQDSFFHQSPNLVNQLMALRAEKAKVAAELVAARNDLTALLTARQEALLVIMGILE